MDKGTKQVPHNAQELEKLLSVAKGARSILEVGSRYGEVLKMLAHGMDGKGRVVSVDLPGVFPWGESDSAPFLTGAVEGLKAEGYDASLFLGNSRDPEIIKAVQDLGPFDFVFIDGDHHYEGAKADWENYGPMGKTVVFHDIIRPSAERRQELEVWRLWREIEGDKEEFVGKESLMGLGIVRL